ncbi:anthranilate phosphoribosyltransferase [Pseudonocardia spinosispora]|uniref:anthranilate phosphoribosyltransferase n=1 Tax=Pseudonocardia spinosispora TaxID=103441 RepID=UPI0003F6E3A0|nr:anthranilate phosphoribosyltransferase [Pseudonocardia spinosispora]
MGGERTWPDLIGLLLAGTDLTEADTAWVMDQVLAGDATDVRLAGFLIALRGKGETAEEIAGLAKAMLAHGKRVTLTTPAVDVVGTGGDRSHSVNISTMTSVVVAAAGVPVVKHGNRAASSRSGAADLLEELGVSIGLDSDAVARCVRELGIGFCFAPVFHSSMRFAAAARRELGVPTAMNLLGPLTNPAQPSAGLVGCADQRLAPVIAEVLAGRGSSALVVRGDDGLDEITTTSTTSVWVVSDGKVRRDSLDVTELGLPRVDMSDLRGGDVAFNADVARRLFAGETGPVRDAVLVNAAGAVAAFTGLSDDLVTDLRTALDRVAAAVDSGAAESLLARWVTLSNSLSEHS